MIRGTTPNRRVHWDAEGEPSAPPSVTDGRACQDDFLDIRRCDNDLTDANRSAHWDTMEDDRACDWNSYIDDPMTLGRRKAAPGRRVGPVRSESSLNLDRNNNACSSIAHKNTSRNNNGDNDNDDVNVNEAEEEKGGQGEEEKGGQGVTIQQEIVSDEDLLKKEKMRRECVPIRILNTILLVLSFSAFIVGLLVTLYEEALRIDSQTKNQTKKG